MSIRIVSSEILGILIFCCAFSQGTPCAKSALEHVEMCKCDEDLEYIVHGQVRPNSVEGIHTYCCVFVSLVSLLYHIGVCIVQFNCC